MELRRSSRRKLRTNCKFANSDSVTPLSALRARCAACRLPPRPPSPRRGLDATALMTNDGSAFAGETQRESDDQLADAFPHLVADAFPDPSDASAVGSEAASSEASMNVLMRYMGCSAKPYMWCGPTSSVEKGGTSREDDAELPYRHDLREGDHVFRWKMLGFCYPIQVHGIVFSVGPDFVTIVDCGLTQDSGLDKVGHFEDGKKNAKKTRSRMNVLTLTDDKEIKRWTKIRYGEEVRLEVHSSNLEMRHKCHEEGDAPPGEDRPEEGEESVVADPEESPSAGLELEEVETCVGSTIKAATAATATPATTTPRGRRASARSSSWFSWSRRDAPAAPAAGRRRPARLRLPRADPPALVLARLRFLLERGEATFPPPADDDRADEDREGARLLPPHHLLYANSECIAVFCTTGRWSTLQASLFLHSSALGNAKQSVALAAYLGAQTAVVPASGWWGFFGGTTTIGLFAAQPWLVPALVGGGMVYVGLPMVLLLKTKGRWADTEKRLNEAFWSMYDTDVIVEMIRCWSGLED